MKYKQLFKSIFFAIVAVLFGCTPFIAHNNLLSASAYAPSRYSQNKGNQSVKLTLDNIILNGQNSNKMYLYANGNGISSAKEVFACYNTCVYSVDFSGSAEEVSASVSSIGAAVNGDNQLISTINLSNNIIIAANQGLIDINASAFVASKAGIKASVGGSKNDPAEYVTMTLYAYDTNSNSQISDSAPEESRDDYNGTADKRTLLSSAIKGQNVNTVELVFASRYNQKSGWVTSVNYLRVKLPEITFTTTDQTAPIAPTIAGGSTIWARERVLTLTGVDNESGVQKIEVSKDGGNTWETAINFVEDNTDYKTENSSNFTLTENGTYIFRTVDNVGNISAASEPYVEEHIDRVAPSINADNISGVYLNKTFTFNANLISNNLSPDTYSYVVSLGGREVLSSELKNGENSFSVSENGEYVITFSAQDEAGNVMESFSHTFAVAEININNFYTSNDVEFSADVSSNGLSNYNFTYDVLKAETSVASNSIVSGNNVLTLTENGKYELVFNFYANGVLLSSKNVQIDNTLYTVTTSAINGTVSDGFSSLRADGVQITFAANEGYEPYTVSLNGEIIKLHTSATSYTFDLKENTEIVVTFRKTISVTLEKNYIYNYGNLSLLYETEIDKALVNFTIFDAEGTLISNPEAYHFNAGTYLVNFEIDTEEYAGIGTTSIIISPKPITISNVKTIYNFNANGISFVYDSSEVNADILVKFYQDSVSTNFEAVGEYSYEFVCDSNYVVNCTGTAVILPIISATANQITTYGDENYNKFSYTVAENIEVIVLYYHNNVLVANPVNNGVYDVKFVYKPNETSYEIPFENATLEILKREVEVRVDNISKEYDGTILTPTYSVKNMALGETFDFTLVGNVEAKAGSYNISIKNVDSEKALENYEVTYVSGTVTITARKLTIMSSEGLSKEYGSEDPTFDDKYAVVSGLIAGDTFTLSLSREPGEDVGYYSIVVNSFENDNYEINFISTKFQITKRAIFVSLKNITKVYDGTDACEYDFVKNNTNILDDDFEVVYNAITRESGSNVGRYKIYVDESLLPNYIVISREATLTITKRPVTIVADNIKVTYGDKINLTYSADNLVAGDTFSGELSKENGTDVGFYTVAIGTLNNSNYNITFIGGTLEIAQKELTIIADSKIKTYGEEDNLTYSTIGLVSGDNLSGKLSREAGEIVGKYEINLGDISNSNYNINFVSGVLEIVKAEISIEIDSKVKSYNSADEILTFTISGIKYNDILPISAKREVGENVGSYKITLVGTENLENYTLVSVNEAYYEIIKADVAAVLADKKAVYSGNPVEIDKLQIAGIGEDEIRYEYSSYIDDLEKGLPINATEYYVKAIFDGNDNYNAFTSNTATINILPKKLPITLTKTQFVYDGEAKLPEYDINLENDVSVTISFEGGTTPKEIGTYKFTINSNDNNYYSSAVGELIVFSPFVSSNDDATVTVSNVSFVNSALQLVEVKNSSLKSTFSSSTDGRRCARVYSFKNVEGLEGSNEVLKVSIKAQNRGKNVELYIANSDGTVTPVSYELVDGYYILSVNDLSSSILVTVSDQTAYYARIIVFTLILLLTYFITKSIKKRKNNNFFNKNTAYRAVTEKDYKDNEEIVEMQLTSEEEIDIDSFIS